MDSADAAPPLGAWASIRGYFTPATLFVVVNLVIGTIALTSRATQQRRRRDHRYYHDDDAHHLLQDPLHPHPQHHEYDPYYPQSYSAPPPAPAPLARTSSVLDRLRSLGLYRFRSGDFPPEYGAAAAVPAHAHDVFAPVEEEAAAAATTQEAYYARSRSEPAPAAREETGLAAPRMRKSGSEVRKAEVARAPARVVQAVAEDYAVDARAEEFANFRREPPPLQREYHYQEAEYAPPLARAPAVAPAPLARTSSVMDRLRGLYGYLAPEQPAAAETDDGFATPADEKKQAHYDRSRSEPAREQGKKEKKQQAKSRMAKSSSEARKPAAPRLAEVPGGECVNARAEAFIDSFKQQQYQEAEYVPPPAPAPLSRTSSVLNRLRSFGLYRFVSGDLGPEIPAEATPPADEKHQGHNNAHYGRSRSEPAREQGKEEARMSKSSSTVAEEEVDTADQGVDARADDFINKFRQQLQLQRLNSLLNYNRGGGKQ